ncbi:MAG: hypothetical protein HYU97_00030 [Deltaproteobacteria bacterium]|nr:hypothetical protein [Deltaproteobacteria bacterium]
MAGLRGSRGPVDHRDSRTTDAARAAEKRREPEARSDVTQPDARRPADTVGPARAVDTGWRGWFGLGRWMASARELWRGRQARPEAARIVEGLVDGEADAVALAAADVTRIFDRVDDFFGEVLRFEREGWAKDWKESSNPFCLRDDLPMDHGQLYTFPQGGYGGGGKQGNHLVAGMLGEGVGFIVDVNTGRGKLYTLEGDDLRVTDLYEGLNFINRGGETMLEENQPAFIFVRTEAGGQFYLFDDWQQPGLGQSSFRVGHPSLVGELDDVQSIEHRGLLSIAGLRLEITYTSSVSDGEGNFDRGNMRLNVQREMSGSTVSIDGYALEGEAMIELGVDNHVHRLQVGDQVFYVLANANIEFWGRHLFMVLPVSGPVEFSAAPPIASIPIDLRQHWQDHLRRYSLAPGTELGDAIQAFGDLPRDGDYILWDGLFTVRLRTFSMGVNRVFRTLDFVESDDELSKYSDHAALVAFLTLTRAEIAGSLNNQPNGP